MITGISPFNILPGSTTPTFEIAIDALAVPYAAPALENTRAAAHPMNAKNCGYETFCSTIVN